MASQKQTLPILVLETTWLHRSHKATSIAPSSQPFLTIVRRVSNRVTLPTKLNIPSCCLAPHLLLSSSLPQARKPPKPSNTTRHTHNPQIEPRQAALKRTVQREREPSRRHNSLRPPLSISLLVLLQRTNTLLLSSNSVRALLLLQLRLAAQSHEIANHAREPRAVRPDVDPRGVAGLIPAGRQRRREDFVVREQRNVLEGLEDEVEGALRESRGVQHAVLARLGALQELAQPCVERRHAQETEGRAAAGEQGGEGGD
jgi:hypothetical protein